ncbi:30S ribosomal protein S4 [Candidatus Woesearchaeota archaeon]|nr:30S ribosomal protein S4 [Candidatus Woesearchaeota archaeon]
MGDPKQTRKKYATPSHPWNRERIEEERVIKRDYGLKNKKEIWKMQSILSRSKDQAKRLIPQISAQAKKEEKDLIQRLHKMGLISATAKLEDVLGLTAKDVMERRLQTIVFKKGLARSVIQSRQFISHGHVFVNNRKVTVPSYIVLKGEENSISFDPASALASPEHPERVVEKVEKPKIITAEQIVAEEHNLEEEIKEGEIIQ